MKFRFGFVCDDVRREDSGKLILIGVYGSSIIVPQFPAALVLALIVVVESEAGGELASDFQISLDDKEIILGKGQLKLSAAGLNYVPIKNIPLEITQAGVLHFKMKIDGKEWQTVCSLPIALNATST